MLKIIRTFVKYYTIHKQQKQNETLCIINIPASFGGLRHCTEGVLHFGRRYKGWRAPEDCTAQPY
jgi:hypothetical protein